jgi:chemotaxis protein MotB
LGEKQEYDVSFLFFLTKFRVGMRCLWLILEKYRFMKQAYYLSACALGVFLISACGTGKKLEQTTQALNEAQASIAKQTETIAGLNGQIDQLKKENVSYAKEMQTCREAKEAVVRNLTAMNTALAEQGTSIRKIYAKAESALLKFDEAGATVEYRNGLVHIGLRDELMFNSGSATIGWEGKQALQVVADVLKDNPGVSAYVIGNTDSQPVRTGYKDNWSLSTERANAITRTLIDEYKVNPASIISGGRASFNPLTENETAAGRAQNRRTDIILNPNLDKLWEKK